MKKLLKNEWFLSVRSYVFAVLLFCLTAVLITVGLGNTAIKRKEQAIKSAYDSIRRAVVTCYAIEGRYPESFRYIRDNYGVYINEDEFAVFYTIFGSNIPPNFTVVEKR